MSSDIEIRVIDKLAGIIEDIKSGLDPEVLATWYRVIEGEAKVLCPEELRESISVEQDPVLWLKFKVKSSRRAVPFLIEAIENNLSQMSFATRLYFQKVEEILTSETAKVGDLPLQGPGQ